MEGAMQRWPLTVSTALEHAARWHGQQEIVCRTVEGPVTVSSYSDLARRARLCAIALQQQLGITSGDVIGTLAWNTTRHLEAWYGIMGIGAVCHTLNPRLSEKDIAYIADHGEDQVILVDLTFLPIIDRIWQQLPRLRAVVVLTDRQHMPQAAGSLPASLLRCYEELLDAALPDLATFSWPPVDEGAPAGLCYTSGTTGNPKGIRYTHRSNMLHALIVPMPDALCLSASSTVLMIVPMFHANSWGLNFAGPLVGCRLVLPGPALDGASLHHLIQVYRVDVTAMVPTVVLGLLQHWEAHKQGNPGLRRLVIGGAAPPRSMIAVLEKMGIEVRHMWGLTELSPLGSLGMPSSLQVGDGLTQEELIDLKVAQGRPHVFCDMRIVDDEGRELPHDGNAVGELQVRGPIVVQQYHKHPELSVDAEKWFSTGDIASIDAFGAMRISDRRKDVIKSGGEWLSSVCLENAAMAHDKVMEAAVIAMPDERWGERPLLVVVPKPGAGDPDALRNSIIAFMAAHPDVAKFAAPDDVVFVDEIPHTATGKISKLTLRKAFAGHVPRGRPRSKL